MRFFSYNSVRFFSFAILKLHIVEEFVNLGWVGDS